MKTLEISRLAAALEALPVGLILCDPAGKPIWANQKARQWLALPVEPDQSEHSLQALLPGLPWPPTGEMCHVRGNAGQLLAVQAWPLEASAGFVVQLQPAYERTGDWQPLILQQLLEGLRHPVANIRAAIETMTAYPDMAPDLATQFRQIILEQTEALTRLLEQTVATYTRYLQAHWPLERIPVAVLLELMAAALAQEIQDVQVEQNQPTAIVRADRQLWRQLWERLGRQLHPFIRKGKGVRLTATVRKRLVWVDVQWQGQRLPPGRLQRWLAQTLPLKGQHFSLALAEVLAWHEADLWVQRDADGHRLRLVIPVR
ncbi:MAG: PAS domain-containing protein [Rhodothermus sp.]|nr:PAS domain-containing protein [Rhodothermus sp.]